MNETHERQNPSSRGGDRNVVRSDFLAGEVRCTARSSRTGERCKRAAMLGGNVCRSHGGNAPQVKAKAQRRLQQAADALVQRLLGMALDGDTPDHVALAAIRDALDRAGLGAKQAVEVEVTKAPYEELLSDVLHVTRAQHEALKHGEPLSSALPRALHAPPDPGSAVIDAEVVEPPAEDAPASHPERVGERADRPSVPDWAEPPPAAPPSRELVTLEQAASEVAAANRASRVSQARRKRR